MTSEAARVSPQEARAARVAQAAVARAAAQALRDQGLRRCSKCKVVKPFEDYHRNGAPGRFGYQFRCKDCVRQDHIDHPEKLRKRSWVAHLRRKYGLSLDDWNAMLIAQSGLCAICDIQLRDPCVDHDHGTGCVRGLLCNPCNRRVHEGPISWYAAAARYLDPGVTEV